ncbi:RNA-directed DNA polymerase [Candidatus Peregrinibacteria bacterium]|nr:RNA-directed DNA polymerase [Candidatus Peregrinibacteria bacterium]
MSKSQYRAFRIKKSNGGWREILEPNPELKAKQRAILAWLMARRISPSPYAHAFVKNRSVLTNALNHVGKKVVVRIDIKNFFPSITNKQVVYALIKEGIAKGNAEEIAGFCTLNDKLPQGAPTSPFLSNVVFKQSDYRLAGLARRWLGKRYATSYSRYADDLIFSSNYEHLNHIYYPVSKILEDEGFEINDEKFRVYRNSKRQIVAGVVVNVKPNILRNERRKLRAFLYNAKKAILEGRNPEINLSVVRGKIAHINGVNPAIGGGFLAELRNIEELLKVKGLAEV